MIMDETPPTIEELQAHVFELQAQVDDLLQRNDELESDNGALKARVAKTELNHVKIKKAANEVAKVTQEIGWP
jgi:regulator of replication initiation timing